MLCDAREFADIPANFELTQPRHRVRRRNVNFDYEARGDPIEDPTLKYKAVLFFHIEINLSMHLNPGEQLLTMSFFGTYLKITVEPRKSCCIVIEETERETSRRDLLYLSIQPMDVKCAQPNCNAPRSLTREAMCGQDIPFHEVESRIAVTIRAINGKGCLPRYIARKVLGRAVSVDCFTEGLQR
ncbi:hypothetical protein TNCV_2770691 [Trichonephila clavipes]|nr:hypothetical protein TNCV_2770691 [Trichonephila clavipes]